MVQVKREQERISVDYTDGWGEEAIYFFPLNGEK